MTTRASTRNAGASARAIETFSEALLSMRASPGHSPVLEVEPRVGRAEALLANGHLRSALADVREVRVLCERHGCEPAVTGRAAFAHARVLAAQGDDATTRTVAREALERIPAERRTHRLLRRSIGDWLEGVPSPPSTTPQGPATPR